MRSDPRRTIDRFIGRDADDRRPKSAVDYSPGKPKAHCGLCVHFAVSQIDPREVGTCDRVLGEIDADMWCELFEAS